MLKVRSLSIEFRSSINNKRVFRVAVNTYVPTYISGSRCTWWQKTTNRHAGQPQYITIKHNALRVSKHITESIRNIAR